jgi:EmrB/QacA subfamily drug resistance transporter
MVNWTVTGFMLAAGAVAPLSGYLGQRFGNKKICFYSIIGLTISSLLCSISWNITMLIIFRIFQGIFSGLIIPATMTMIYQNLERESQAFAISIWGLAAMLVPAFGPTLSGWLIESFNWEAIFLINIPLGVFTALLLKLTVKESNRIENAKLDTFGAITSISASIILLIAFSKSSTWGWTSINTIGLLLLGIALLVVFFRHENKSKIPMLNLEVFKYKKYTISIIISSIITIALYAGSLLTPLFLQNVQQVSALKAGLILLPSSLIMALIMPIVGKLYNKIGARKLIVVGILLLAFGSWKLSYLTIDTSYSYTIIWMTIRSIGISLSMIPATNAGMEVLPSKLSGSASSVSNWVRQGLACLSIGVFASLLTARTTSYSQVLSIENPINQLIPLESFTYAVNEIFLISAIIVLIALPISFMLKKNIDSIETNKVYED